jgi:hypothetical protein
MPFQMLELLAVLAFVAVAVPVSRQFHRSRQREIEREAHAELDAWTKYRALLDVG